MNALELADSVEPLVLTSFHETQYIGRKAADMLRRQHEAIKQLRECLIECLNDSRQAVCDYEVRYGENFRPHLIEAMRKTVADAEQALKDTEEFK